MRPVLHLPDETPRAGASAEPDPPEGPVEPATPSPTRGRQLRWVALDGIVPGLGHLLAGRRRLAALFGIPIVLAVIAVAVIVAAIPLGVLAADALNAFAILLAIQGLVLVWRLLAVLAGLRATSRPDWTRIQNLGAVALVLAVVLPQAYLGYVTNVAREEIDRVFSGQSGGAWVPEPTPDPSATPMPSGVAPSPSAAPAITRLNVLLIGVDSGVGRSTSLTDTMIVASLDPVTETVSMVSIPRDMVDVPLPDGTAYAPKINGIDADARHNPSRFPGSDGSGHDVLIAAVGTLLGLKIDYYALVNLGGFVRVVDILGGVDVSVSRALCDPRYFEYGFSSGFSITAGLHHLNGQQALAYARIRKSSGESDFTRAARQQEVVSGLRDAIVKRGFLSDPVALLQALGRSLETNVPRDLLPQLAAVMNRIDRTKTYRAVIQHPLVKEGFDVRGSIQIPDVAGIRALVMKLFPASGTLADASFLAPAPAASGSGSSTTSGVRGCAPIPTARPTAAPTLAPQPSATAEPAPSGSPEATSSASPAPTGSAVPSPAASPAASASVSPPPAASPSPLPSPAPG